MVNAILLVTCLALVVVFMVLVFPWIYFGMDPLISKYFEWVYGKVKGHK